MRPTRNALLATALALVALAGCEEKGIGRLCDVGVDGGASSGEAVINGQALECPSRICLAATPNVASGLDPAFRSELPACSALCAGDDDCSDGLTSQNDPRLCKSGFKCATATTVGPFCCQKMCVCKDYLKEPVLTPAACDPTNADNRARCVNL